MAIKFLEYIVTPIFQLSANIKIKERVIDIGDALLKARTILVLMPAKLNDFGIALNYLDVVHENFPKAKLVVITQEMYTNLVNDSSYYGTIFVSHRHINMLGLPKRELIQELMAFKYDIAIDLNHEFSLLSSYLCQKSGALLRICLEDSKREPFYNFSFRSLEGETLNNKYRNLFKYLNVNNITAATNY